MTIDPDELFIQQMTACQDRKIELEKQVAELKSKLTLANSKIIQLQNEIQSYRNHCGSLYKSRNNIEESQSFDDYYENYDW